MSNPAGHPLYQEDLRRILKADLPWEALDGRSLLISGATGLIGSCLVDALMTRGGSRVIALGRSREKARGRFAGWWDNGNFRFLQHDITAPLSLPEPVDYVIHLASATHPLAYATDPIGTIEANVAGTRNLLESAVGARRFLFASSNEIYGENRGDVELFDESYMGYIDCNALRAGYPESKRCGEALCQAYIRQKGVDAVIARLTRSYGPTLLRSDTKALSQFLWKGLAGEDIVLKSDGSQLYSYTYAADAVAGLLTVLLKGRCGAAYNVAEESFDVPLRKMAKLVADAAGTRVVFDLPERTEAAGFSKVTKARLDGSRLRALGWKAAVAPEEGIRRTLAILKSL